MDDFCLVDQVLSTIREWIFFFRERKDRLTWVCSLRVQSLMARKSWQQEEP